MTSTVRVVVDTNMLASGAARFRDGVGTPVRIWQHWLLGDIELVISQPLFAEFARTVGKTYFANLESQEHYDMLAQMLQSDALLVVPDPSITGVATHPEDDLVLGTAVAGDAEYLVTGDAQLLKLETIGDCRIMSASAFVDLLESGDA